MVILNFIILIISSLASFANSSILRNSIITILSVILIFNNIYALYNPDELVIGNIFDYPIFFRTEPIANIFVLMVSILNFCTNLYSFCYENMQINLPKKNDLNPAIHFFFTPLAILSTIAIAYSANIVTLFIFYEILTLLTYPLVIQPLTEEAFKAGRTYFSVLFMSSSFFILLAIILIEKNHGISSFSTSGTLSSDIPLKEVVLLLICFVFGFSKTAIFPLYSWLPKAMVAPIPVSSLLHAVVVVKTGVFCLIKVFLFVFGLDLLNYTITNSSLSIEWISYLSCFTIIFASIMAILQNSIKKILAFSTISNLSYMILALSFVSQKSIVIAFMKLLIHSISKITLFFSCGIIYLTTHKTKTSELNQLVKKLPITFTLFILAAAIILGLPFTIGYKNQQDIYYLIPNQLPLIQFSLFISAILSFAYFFKIIYKMLAFDRDHDEIILIQDSKLIQIISAITLSLIILLQYYYLDIEIYLMTIFNNG